jgi:putative endonuclease
VGRTGPPEDRSWEPCGPLDRRSLGRAGETAAAGYLAGCGYRLLARNVRAGGVELDLVAERGGVVVFVEVKTRRSRRLGPPEAAVDARKQARLLRGGAAWLREHRPRARRARFDVISCEPRRDGSWQLSHIEAAFEGD